MSDKSEPSEIQDISFDVLEVLYGVNSIPLLAVLQYAEILDDDDYNPLDITEVLTFAEDYGLESLASVCSEFERFQNMLDNLSDLFVSAQKMAPIIWPSIKDLAIELDEARYATTSLKAAEAEALLQFKADNAALYTELADAKALQDDIEEKLRHAVLVRYDATGIKQTGFGTSAYHTVEYEIDNDEAVRACVSQNLTGALKLNRAAFLKMVKANAVIDLTSIKEIRETIKTKVPGNFAKFFREE